MKKKFSISMLVPGLQFHLKSLDAHSLGGSETAGLSMAIELAKLGHSVRLFCNCTNGHEKDGTLELWPIDLYNKYAPCVPHDVTIVQRHPPALCQQLESRLNILWMHDLALLRREAMHKSALWNIDKIFAVSKYHAAQVRSVYELPESLVVPTRNGITDRLFPPERPATQRKRALLYISRPERGLDILLEGIMPRIWAKAPDVKLYLATYNNPNPNLLAFYQKIETLIMQSGGRVQSLGFLSKPALYEVMQTVQVLAYPTPSKLDRQFREVSCIAAIEAMRSGLPIVTSDLGALPETIAKGAGTIIPGMPWEEEYQQAFANAVLEYLNNGGKWQAASTAGREAAKRLDWADLAKEWTELFSQWLEEKKANKKAVVRTLIRRSDIIAADYLARKIEDKDGLALLDSQLSWRNSPTGPAEMAHKTGSDTTDVFEQTWLDHRLPEVISLIKANGWTNGKMLDYGCAHGSYAVHISNEVGPALKIFGVDIDQTYIEWANKHRENHAKHPEALSFSVGTSDKLPEREFDYAFAGEVLEHIKCPWEVLAQIEKSVKVGGWVMFTVPYGPWEEESYYTYPHRQHLWEIDPSCVEELLANKTEKNIRVSYVRRSRVSGEALGYTIAWYKVKDGEPVREIDIEAKLSRVVPRQTLSALLIGGKNCESTVLWTMDSIRNVVDEIVIGDTGMPPELAERLVKQYGAKIVKVESPLDIGFDAARNAVLEHCTMDWVLWIDTDEHLTNPDSLCKYLRPNIFTGYGIRQHHFSVDTQFSPDLPVRCFRRGAGMRFFGVCHEHPEIEYNKGPGNTILLADVHIAHVGYLSEKIRRDRYWRNLPLMNRSHEKYPDRVLNRFFKIRDNTLKVHFLLEGGTPPDNQTVVSLLEEVIDVYKTHFAGQVNYMSDEALKYYSEACRILGRGFNVAFLVAADKMAPPQKLQPIIARYDDVATWQKDLAKRAESAAEKLNNEWW